MPTAFSYFSPLGRALIALLFIPGGLEKFANIQGTMDYTAAGGLPGFLGLAAGVLEALGGLAILVGWKTRWAALALAAFCVLAATLYHYVPAQGLEGFERQMEMIVFFKDLAIAGGLLLLVAHGAGRLSVDARSGEDRYAGV